jgi:hypothetical protein
LVTDGVEDLAALSVCNAEGFGMAVKFRFEGQAPRIAPLQFDQESLIFGTQAIKHAGRDDDLQFNHVAPFLTYFTHDGRELALDVYAQRQRRFD